VNRRLPLFVGALALATTFAGSIETAEAGRYRGGGARVHFSGSARFSGGVSVGTSYRFARPAWRPHRWSVGGSVYVGPTYSYWPRPYYVYYPQYVPAYYHTTSYYPVAPAPIAAPGVVAVAPVRPELPKLGIGLFAGSSATEAQDGGSLHDSDDMGLLARYRLTPGLILEGELGKTSYDFGGYENVRVDRRVGGSLLYEIGAYNRWAPYVLAGVGVQQAEVAGEFQTTQNYAELGIGLRWAVSRQFHLTADIRAGSRGTVSSSSDGPPPPAYMDGTTARTITPPPASSNASEEYTRARLSAILYF
jgi:hypothetical protein